MIKFSINKRNYKLNNSIDIITIGEAIDIVNIGHNLKEDELDKLLFEEITELSDYERDYIIKILLKLSPDLDLETISKTKDIAIITIWNEVKYIMAQIYFTNFDNYNAIGLTEIDFKGRTYYFPESLEINDENILAYKEPAKNITEAGNLLNIIQSGELEDKGINLLPLLTAIFFREDKSELYDEEKIAKRAELFKDLPLSIGFEAFFFFYYYSINYIVSLRYSLIKPRLLNLKKALTTTLGYIRLQTRELVGLYKRLRK